MLQERLLNSTLVEFTPSDVFSSSSFLFSGTRLHHFSVRRLDCISTIASTEEAVEAIGWEPRRATMQTEVMEPTRMVSASVNTTFGRARER